MYCLTWTLSSNFKLLKTISHYVFQPICPVSLGCGNGCAHLVLFLVQSHVCAGVTLGGGPLPALPVCCYDYYWKQYTECYFFKNTILTL
jgi:hypothetical protein